MSVPTLHLSAAERRSGCLSEEHAAAAVRILDELGCVALRGAVDPTHVDVVCERMLEDMAAYEAGGGTLGHNWQGLRPPPCHPYLFPDMYFNDFAVAVAQAMGIGHPDDGGLQGGGANSNVAYAVGPGHPPTMQEVHTDSAPPFDPDASEADYERPGSVYVNVPLCDAGEETGATEMWLVRWIATFWVYARSCRLANPKEGPHCQGTHRDPGLRRGHGYGDPTLRRSTSWPTPTMLTAWEAKHGPPVRALAKRGDILLRDSRVWHRGR